MFFQELRGVSEHYEKSNLPVFHYFMTFCEYLLCSLDVDTNGNTFRYVLPHIVNQKIIYRETWGGGFIYASNLISLLMKDFSTFRMQDFTPFLASGGIDSNSLSGNEKNLIEGVSICEALKTEIGEIVCALRE